MERIKFKVLVGSEKISKAQKTLEKIIKSKSVSSKEIRLGIPNYGDTSIDAFWVKDHNFWWGYWKAKNSRHMNVFGIGEPNWQGMNNVDCEICSPLSKNNWHIAGAFVEDQSGQIYLTHSGRTGGARTVPIETFKKKFGYPSKWHLIEGTKKSYERLVIGNLKNKNFLSSLGAFISAFLQIKEGKAVTKKHHVKKNSGIKNTASTYITPTKRKNQNILKGSFKNAKDKSDLDKVYEKEEEKARNKTSKMSRKQIDEFISNYKEVSTPKPNKVKTDVYERDPELAEYMKRKNKYTCQLCEKPTFLDKHGNNFVESHHIIPRAKNGKDIPENIMIVCPNCHTIFDSGSDKVKVASYRKLKKYGILTDFKDLLKNKVITPTMYHKILR